MRFGVLGGLEVRGASGEVVSVGGPRPRALLVMLLLNAGRVVTVEELIDGQYGEEPPAGAANAVQAQVSRLRRGLGAGLVEFHGNGYRLAVDPDDVDAHRFERLAREGRRLVAAGHHARGAALLREGLALWRGPALSDLPSGGAQAARLEELRLGALEDLAEAELGLPEGASVAELRGLVDAHPLRERLRAQLMRALHAAGRQAEALEVFEEGRRLLADELGVDPGAELAGAHLDVLRGAEPVPVARRGLPAQLTSFVGREEELALIGRLRDARLVTVVGPGGTGKTRLAVEAAARETAARESAVQKVAARETAGPVAGGGAGAGGVCFVDLTPLAELTGEGVGGEEVARVVLGALGVREGGLRAPYPVDPVRRLAAALGGGRETLLVLDNCEHVVGAAAGLVRELLGECPGLRVLATSREPLGITGEALVTLTPLATPPAGRTAVGEAMAYPAVRLFADRAGAVRQGFEVEPGNVEAVVRICAALEGVPLAIELAAARLRSFEVEEIAARLAADGRFRLLSRGDRTAAARHRTLRAAVEWSWDLLTAGEQALARRFSVFAGGATVAAVEEVCGLDDAAGLLGDLVDKSLVEHAGGRYRMLETIRLFCAERLAESGELEPTRERHGRCFEALAQRADPHLRRGEQLEWLRRLSADHGNLMGALRWAVRHDRDRALRMVAVLASYWWLSGRQSQAGEPAAELLEAVGRPVEGLEEGYVMCVVHASPPAAAEHWERAAAFVAGLDRPLRHPITAALWGMTVGPPARPVGPETDWVLGSDPWSEALGRLGRALLRVIDGDPAGGERDLEDVLGRFRAVGERWGIAQGLDWLAMLAGWRGDWRRAGEMWREALDLLGELGALEEMADVLGRQAEALVREGDLAGGAAAYRQAEEAALRAGRGGAPVMVEVGLGELAQAAGDTGEARRRFERALAASESGGFGARQARGRVLVALARLTAAERRAERRAGVRGSGVRGSGVRGSGVRGSGGGGEARRLYGQAVTAVLDVGLAADLADVAEGLAGALVLESVAGWAAGVAGQGAVSAGVAERAAVLLGAGVAVRGAAVAGDRQVAATAEAAREVLGVEAFDRAYARGRALTRADLLTALTAEVVRLTGEGDPPAHRTG
ncbi:BTAD domain-containing putative transcriptional regulator [Nonomuraea sp. NPDC023979]|uniref:BTAD domain-containing putative transcriptional regulator n=1 Tax=Nonomuraea sp. NPDC023979 TaxID=3154796 RepID=UPI003406A3B9